MEYILADIRTCIVQLRQIGNHFIRLCMHPFAYLDLFILWIRNILTNPDVNIKCVNNGVYARISTCICICTGQKKQTGNQSISYVNFYPFAYHNFDVFEFGTALNLGGPDPGLCQSGELRIWHSSSNPARCLQFWDWSLLLGLVCPVSAYCGWSLWTVSQCVSMWNCFSRSATEVCFAHCWDLRQPTKRTQNVITLAYAVHCFQWS